MVILKIIKYDRFASLNTYKVLMNLNNTGLESICPKTVSWIANVLNILN